MQAILIASDHAGFELKNIIKNYLLGKEYNVSDFGSYDQESVDYPDYSHKLCNALSNEQVGILICGTGIGMSIAANRFSHIRAALCCNSIMTRFAREHNDANILVLGARIIDEVTALESVDIFLNTKFQAGKHKIRVDKI